MDNSQYFSPEYQEAQRTMTSRRAKSEQNKLVKQTIWLSVGAVIFLLASFFFIIPGVIRFIGGFSGGNTNTADETLPPQMPIISVPALATPSASITLDGYTTQNVEVIVVKNGEEHQRATADGEGKFSVPVSLDKGENKITLYSKNGEKESPVTEEYVTVFDNEKPSLEIQEPTEGQEIQGKRNQNFTVKGKTDSGTKVSLNERIIFTQEDGTFSSTFRLENGQNTLTFKAVDEAGNTTEKVVNVKFSE